MHFTSVEGEKAFPRMAATDLSHFLCRLFILLCLFSLATSDFGSEDALRKSTVTPEKSLASKETQPGKLINDHSGAFYPSLNKSLPEIVDLPNTKRSRIEARASLKFADYFTKGIDLHRDVMATLRYPRSRDSGPGSVGGNWTVTDIYPGNPALQDPLFPEDETACDDSDSENEDDDEHGVEGGIDIFSAFALDSYRINRDTGTFKDIIAYLKSNSNIRYRNYYGPSAGVLIAKSVYGQAGDTRAPDRWSDVAWPLWTAACQQQSTPPSGIRLIIQEAIANDDTKELLNELTHGKPQTKNGQPAIFSWTPDNQGYYALLQSPNGIGAAYISLHYPNAMGRKYVSKIRAYKDYDIWTMMLELTPIE